MSMVRKVNSIHQNKLVGRHDVRSTGTNLYSRDDNTLFFPTTEHVETRARESPEFLVIVLYFSFKQGRISMASVYQTVGAAFAKIVLVTRSHFHANRGNTGRGERGTSRSPGFS